MSQCEIGLTNNVHRSKVNWRNSKETSISPEALRLAFSFDCLQSASIPQNRFNLGRVVSPIRADQSQLLCGTFGE